LNGLQITIPNHQLVIPLYIEVSGNTVFVRRRESFLEGNAELLVYLVDEGNDIYIGVLVALVATLLAGLCSAESLGCLGVAESLMATPWPI
jgi:hypothetical protein